MDGQYPPIEKGGGFGYTRRNMVQQTAAHWADLYAEKIVREKGEKEEYTCASGITPSGTVHIGNFREIISVELVVRALREMGKKVRFIYSWDDYDVFRKVPKNMPKAEELQKYLRYPITCVPDPFDRDESYARHHEVDIENILPRVGVFPEFLYQAARYRSSMYAADMRKALESRVDIKRILDDFRTENLGEDWWPISVFCDSCQRDTTKVEGWDGEWGVTYRCDSCGRVETVDLRTAKGVKLFWRVDWPMRWAREKVDFEPAGKDHHSQGGSFDTAREVVKVVFGTEAPVSFQYDFIGIKGRGGKISSSSGEVIDLHDVLEVYQPEIARYLFAGTRPNTEFTISFDLDVIKIYEDYDRTERVYFGVDQVGDEKRAKESRIYELSQVAEVPEAMPYQAPFRHLCNLLQINAGDIERTIASLPGLEADQVDKLTVRASCAWNWITRFAPDDFRFALREDGSKEDFGPPALAAVRDLRSAIEAKADSRDEKALSEEIYSIAQKNGIEPKEFFKAVYRALVGKDQGPRLAAFILTVGRERILRILSVY
jgi:lysyl-tRNA synthetase, class I